LTEKATVLDQEISDFYDLARDVAPGEQNVRFDSLGRKLKELAPSNRRTGGNIEAIVGDLQSKGVLDDNFKIIGRVDVETAEDVRKLANELFDPQNGFGNAKLREIKDALDDDVFRAAGDDIFKQARAAKTSFERELTRAKISKFDSRKANIVRDILENKIDPDRMVEQTVFSKKWRATDLKQLKDYISTGDAGKAAFDDLRAETLEAIKVKSFIGPEDAQGFQRISRDRLQKALSTVGDGKMSVLFSPKERKFLSDMVTTAKILEPVRGTALGRGPSAQAVRRLEDKLTELPVIGEVFEFSARGALKAKPKRIIQTLPSPARSAAGVGAVAALPQEQEIE
jgi:hypothetical protein